MRPPLSENVIGILFGVGAYLMWGFVPIYWKFLMQVSPVDAIVHRVFWAAVIIAIILRLRGRLALAMRLLTTRRNWVILGISSALVAVNWSIFVWAVMSDHILEASLGYYINPLFSVLIGFAFLGERMNRVQTAAIALAVVGVVGMVVLTGSLPWPSLALAATFAAYGYMRKIGRFVAMDALFIEMGLCVPFCLAVTFMREATGATDLAAFTPAVWLLLMGGGLVTFLPLWCFGEGVSRTSLTTIGLLQFIAPTMQFALAVLAYNEPLTGGQLFAFVFIWLAVGVYMTDMVWRERRLKGLPQSG